MMKGCGCNVEGMEKAPWTPRGDTGPKRIMPIPRGDPIPVPPPAPAPPPPTSRYERCLDRVLHNYEHGMIRGQDGSPSPELFVAEQMACKHGY